MQRITSQKGAIGVNLETLEPRRLLSGTVEAVDRVAPFPITASPTLTEAPSAQDTEMTRWIVNFERPTFELFPGGNRAVDLDAIYNPEVIIDRDAQIAELGSEIRFVHNLVHQYSILVEAPADMTEAQMTAILSRLDGFKSVAQDQVIVSGRPSGEVFSQQRSAGTSPAGGFWIDHTGSSLVDLDDDADNAILMLTTPAGELLG